MTASPRSGRAWAQALLVLLVVGGSVGVARWMVTLRKQVVSEPRPVVAPLVELTEVALGTEQLFVRTLGELRPRREGALNPEVAGRVVRLAPEFVAGGTVEEGDALVVIDAGPLEVGILSAQAAVAQAEARVDRLEAEAERNIAEWRRTGREEEPPPLLAKIPDLAEARAMVASAEASLKEAELDLDRATVRAPFRGRVRSVNITVGGFVQPGQTLGELYQTDPMEVRMNLTERELARLDLNRLFAPGAERPAVQVGARVGGRGVLRTGRVTRVSGEVDRATRMVELVAELDAGPSDEDELPLFTGDFVTAQIEGRRVDNAARLPGIALYEPGLCLVVDPEGGLHRRRVEVAMRTGHEIVVSAGLEDGERVVVSPVDVAVEGMLVRVSTSDTVRGEEAP